MECKPGQRWRSLPFVKATIVITTLCLCTLAVIYVTETASLEGSKTETQEENSNSKAERSLNNVDLPNGYRVGE